MVLWPLWKSGERPDAAGAAAVHGAREGERPHPGRVPGDSSCTRCPEPLLPWSFCSGGRGVPLHLRRRLVFPRELPPWQPSCCQEAGPGARELLAKSRSLEGQGRSSSRCFG